MHAVGIQRRRARPQDPSTALASVHAKPSGRPSALQASSARRTAAIFASFGIASLSQRDQAASTRWLLLIVDDSRRDQRPCQRCLNSVRDRSRSGCQSLDFLRLVAAPDRLDAPDSRPRRRRRGPRAAPPTRCIPVRAHTATRQPWKTDREVNRSLGWKPRAAYPPPGFNGASVDRGVNVVPFSMPQRWLCNRRVRAAKERLAFSTRLDSADSAPNAGETLSTPPRLKLFYIDRIVISIDIGGPSDPA